MPNTHRRCDAAVELSRRRRRCEHNLQLAHDDCRRVCSHHRHDTTRFAVGKFVQTRRDCRQLVANSVHTFVWLGGVAVGCRIRDRDVASSIPGCSAARCNSGQVVHTRVPLFTKQYKLVPASAGGKVQHRNGVGHAGNHYRRTLRLAANRRHSSIVLTCGCRCTAALM